MTDVGYNGYPFTWCNGSRRRRTISKRLDRVLINEDWAEAYQFNRVDHIDKTGSDHSLILFRSGNEEVEAVKYFKFLNFWTESEGFLSIVEGIWSMEVRGNSLWKLQQKLKAVSKGLTSWSKESVGNVFQNVKKLEEDIS